MTTVECKPLSDELCMFVACFKGGLRDYATKVLKGFEVKVEQNDFDGQIEKINEEKRKLEVMVRIFGRKTPLELSYMQVEKL